MPGPLTSMSIFRCPGATLLLSELLFGSGVPLGSGFPSGPIFRVEVARILRPS